MKKFLVVFTVALTALFVMPKITEAGIITPPADDQCTQAECDSLQNQINGLCSQAQCNANSAAIAANAASIATRCSQATCNANSAAIAAGAAAISTNTDMIDMVKDRFRLVNNVCDRETAFVNRIAILQEASCDANCDSDEQVTGCSFSCFNTILSNANCYRLSVLESGPINSGQGCRYRVVNNNLQNNIVGNSRVMLSVTAHCAQVDFP